MRNGKERTSFSDRAAEYLRSHSHPGGIIVCQEPRFIYMKAPRTGGTSIFRQTLEKMLLKKMPLDLFHHKDHPHRFGAWLKNLSDADLEQYFLFTFVRNPWDRAVSIASYFQIPFSEFAIQFHHLIRQDRNLMQHSLPLHNYSHLNGKPFVDFIGRFETLQADIDRICQVLGLSQSQLPVSSQSRHDHYSTYYNLRIRSQIDEIYGQDAQYFEYQFGENAHVREGPTKSEIN